MVVPGTEVQIGRSCAYQPLRKPSLPTGTSSTRNLFSDKLIQGFESKFLLLDEDTFKTAGETIEKEILCSLNEGALTTSKCLQLFLDTAWKDRNRSPIIAEIFHNIAQVYEDESETGLTALLEKTCNNLLNILTLLGKPEVNDLSIVTLLANLYRLADLPAEHKEGVESYLVDIAKAFWPYFVPQKREVWDNELVSDAICDVFHTIGGVLEEKCPVNMERTFTKITNMLISTNSISTYTRCRLLEVKESRAKGWTLPECTRDYYKAVFLKHPKGKHDSRSPSPTSPTATPKREFLINDKYEVTAHGKWTTVSEKPCQPLVIRVKPKPLPGQNNNISAEAKNSNTTCCIVSNSTSKGSKDQRLQNISEQEHADNSETGEISTPKSRGTQDQRNGFGSPKDDDEFNPKTSTDFKEGNQSPRLGMPNCKEITHHTQFSPSSSCSDSLLYFTPQNPKESDSRNSTTGRNTPNGNTPTENLSSPFDSSLHSEEKSPLNTGNSSKNSSFSRGFSCPESRSPPNFSESPFSRHNSFNNDGSTTSRQRLSSTGEPSNHTRSPFYSNGGLRRSYSESSTGESKYSRWEQSPNGCDSTGFGHSEGGFGRPNYHRQSSNYRRRSNLEFPIKEVLEGEDVDTTSRLYLLSFATSPAALERPADLTLTPEIEAEKEWLKDVILDEPITVPDRFGQ